MKHLPQDVKRQVDLIKTALESGTHWSQIGGRRHHHGQHIIFNLKHWYRLICWHPQQASLRLEIMTHEKYNRLARNTYR